MDSCIIYFHIPKRWYLFTNFVRLSVVCFWRNFAAENKTIKIMALIIVNGERREVKLPLTLTELIEFLHVENPEMVSVQVNEEFAEREEWNTKLLQENDSVDFLYFMGGGAR